jgi:hydrogenase maturation protease
MTAPKILVACIGNIFHGDDVFGVELARQIGNREIAPNVTTKDFGIRSFDLAYALMDPYDFVILVDACSRGGEPGSIYVIEPDPIEGTVPGVEAHSMNPMSVLRMVRSMQGTVPPMLIVGCEPQDLGSMEEGRLGLTAVVEAAIPEAIQLIEEMIEKVNRVQFPLEKGELWNITMAWTTKPAIRSSSLEGRP